MIAIIGAMDQEVAILREKMENKESTTIANCEFIKGTLEGKDVVLLQSGIGKVNAAMSTTILLERYNPEYVINTGSAGGFHTELSVGDVVISTEVRHHDVDVTHFNYVFGQVPGMPAAYTADAELMTLAEKAIGKTGDVKVVKGGIATGDSFIGRADQALAIRDKFENLYAVEMEAAAVAQVCHQFNKPFVIIRSLSDIAGKESHVSFDAYLDQAAKHSSEFIVEMIKGI